MLENSLAQKESLHEERVKILAEVETLRRYMQTEVDTEPDEGDAEIFEREKNSALISVLERRLHDIETALSSIDKGRYGICERCDEPISPERLEVKPDATHCVACQEEVERLSRRGRITRQQW